jgi:hypothetical protein
MSYKNLNEYLTGEEQAKLKVENKKKEDTKRVILNNLKVKTLYDPFTFMEDLLESQADTKFSRKTIQQKAEISSNEQYDLNMAVNMEALQIKVNEIITVLNVCCPDNNIEDIFLNTDDKHTLKLKFLEFYYNVIESEKEEKRREKEDKKQDRNQDKTKKNHRDRALVNRVNVKDENIPQSLNVLIRRLLNPEDNLVLFELISIIGQKITEKTPLSEEDEYLLKDLKELYRYSKEGKGGIKSLQVMIELIFGFISYYDDGDGMKVKYRQEYPSPLFNGVVRYRMVKSQKIKKGYITEVFKRMGFTNSQLNMIFTETLLGNPTPDRALQILTGFGSRRKLKNKKRTKNKKRKKKTKMK